MGMSLRPIKPTRAAPRYRGKPVPCDFNLTAWGRLRGWLKQWGVDTSEFTVGNDGQRISATTCAKVADAIETHLPELPKEDRQWLAETVKYWRTCGGFYQY
jgi:hypothetical protein